MNSSSIKKFVAGAVGIALAFAFVVGAATPAQAATVEELTAQINSLLSTIAALQSQLSTMQGGTTGGSTGSYSFTKDLTIGSTGADVTALQQALVAKGYLTMPAGVAYGYFGKLTQSAVAKWQAAAGISPAAGYFGPKSRAAFVTAGGTSGGTVIVPPTGGGLSVTAATQPAPQLAPEGAARVPFTKVILTAGSSDVTVNSITVQRVGSGQDAAFAGVVLVDENGQQIGLAKTLNSNHQATVGEAFTVKAGTSKTITIAGNMASTLDSYAGEVPALSVISVNSASTVTGSLPITGTGQVINATLTIGSVTMTETYDPGTQNKEIGTSGYKFESVKVTAGSGEDLRLYSIRWNQSGSASASDVINVVTDVDGTSYPTILSADGKYYTTTFGSGIVIAKGFSKEISVKADIVGGPERTVAFDIYRNTDLYISGETFGYGITPPTGGTSGTFGTTQPWYDASVVTIKPGQVVTVGRANEVASQNIAVNVPNQTLGGFKTNFKGEKVQVQGMVFTVASTSGTGYGLLTNVTVVDDNGAVVAGPVDATVGASTQTITFTDSVTFPVGAKVYTIKGKVASTVGNNTQYTVTGAPSDWTSPVGESTGNTVDLSGVADFTMNSVTVKTGALVISLSSVPASQTITAGSSGVTMANYVFDATQSGEDVRFNAVTLTLGGTGTATNLTNCGLYTGDTLETSTTYTGGSTVAMTMNSQFVIPKNSSKTLTLKCDVASGATLNYVWGITPSASNPAITGVSSGGDIDATPLSALTGGTMTIGSATLAVSAHSSSPIFGLMTAGTSGNTIGVLNVTGKNAPITLSDLGLTFDNVTGNVSKISIVNGSDVVAEFPNPSNGTATTTFNKVVTVPANGSIQLAIKADLNDISEGGAGIPGDTVKAQLSNLKGTGAGADVYSTGTTSFAGKQIQKAYPTITYSTTAGTIANGTNDLLSLSVTANGGDVQLYKLTFGFSSTTVTATGFGLTGPTGNVSTTSSNTYGAAVDSSTSTIKIFFDSTSNSADKTISKGQTKTYTLRAYGVALLGGTNRDQGSMNVYLKADTATTTIPGSNLMASTSQMNIQGYNIIWSPISTSTESSLLKSDLDWTNGYGLEGCFLSAGLGNDCTPRTISK